MQEEMNLSKWAWMMDYCKKQRIPPAQTWAWDEAKAAYESVTKTAPGGSR